MQVSGCNDDYEDDIEIYLGLVPNSTLVEHYVHPLQSDLPNAPIPQFVPKVQAPIQNEVAYQNNANSGYPNANTGYPHANTGYPQANTGYPHANTGYPHANTGYQNANAGHQHVNTGYQHSSQSNYTGGIPMAPMSHSKVGSQSNIGFVVPQTPPSNAPYMSRPNVPYQNFSPTAPPN